MSGDEFDFPPARRSRQRWGNRASGEFHKCQNSHCQVLRGFKVRVQPRRAKQKLQARHSWHRGLLPKLLVAKKSKAAAKKEIQMEKTKRSVVVQNVRALDRQMHMLGIPLSTFMISGVPTQPLLVGERRREVRFDAWTFEVPAGLRQLSTRMAIDAEEGGRRYEMAEVAMGKRPLLSICGDQGGKGLAS